MKQNVQGRVLRLTIILMLSISMLFGSTIAMAEVNMVPQVSILGESDTGEINIQGVSSFTDGSYVVCGKTNSRTGVFSNGNGNAFIAKYSPDGTLQWVSNRFGGTNGDVFYDVSQIADGGYIAVGYSGSSDGDMAGLSKATWDTSAIIVKYDSSGAVVWKKCFGGTRPDTFYAVTQTSDGSFVAVGSSLSRDYNMAGLLHGTDYMDAIAVKYDANGNILWKQSFGGVSADSFWDVTADDNGGFVGVGATDSRGGDVPIPPEDTTHHAIMVHYDSSGNRDWINMFGLNWSNGGSSIFRGVCRTPDGGFVAVGQCSAGTYTNLGWAVLRKDDGIVFKYDASGTLVWRQAFIGTAAEEYVKVSAMTNGEIVAVGTSTSSDFDMANVIKKKASGTEAIITKLTSDGDKAWTTTFGGTASSNWDRINNIASLPGNEFLAVGVTNSTTGDLAGIKNTTDYEGFIVKYVYPDSQPPTVSVTSLSITLDFDDISGVATTEYSWCSSDTEAPTNWITYNEAITQSENGTWYLWVRTADSIGNAATQCIGGPYQVGTPTLN